MIDLSKNTNPYYPSRSIKNHLKNTVFKINNYPHKNSDYIKKTLSKYFDISEQNITTTNGTLGAFDSLIKNTKAKNIGFIVPTFWGMQCIASNNNCKLVYKKIKDNYSVDDIISLAKNTDLLYICNPNNPTLAYISKHKILKIVEKNPSCHFVIDETLLNFSPFYHKNSLYPEVVNYSNLSVLISFSKIFNLGGLRIGMLCSNISVIKKIEENNVIFCNNVFVESIIKDIGKDFFRIDRAIFQKNFNSFYVTLNKKHVEKFVNMNVSFVNVKFKKYVNTQKMLKFLRKNNFIIADLSSMYLELDNNWLRVSVGKLYEMKRLAILMNEFLEVNYGEKNNNCK